MNAFDEYVAQEALNRATANMVRAIRDLRSIGWGTTSADRLLAAIQDLTLLAGTDPQHVESVLGGCRGEILPSLRDQFQQLLDPSREYDELRRRLYDAAVSNVRALTVPRELVSAA